MRNLVAMKKWSVCLVAVVAACSGPAGNDAAADGNAAVNAEAAVEAGNEAAGNEAASPADGNEAAAPAEGNAVADVAATYRASGTEPFWSLTMTAAQMVYDSADGPDVTVATPEAQSRRAGQLFPTPQMTVFVSAFRDCEGADEQQGNTVRVTIGEQTVTGCGSGTLPD